MGLKKKLLDLPWEKTGPFVDPDINPFAKIILGPKDKTKAKAKPKLKAQTDAMEREPVTARPDTIGEDVWAKAEREKKKKEAWKKFIPEETWNTPEGKKR